MKGKLSKVAIGLHAALLLIGGPLYLANTSVIMAEFAPTVFPAAPPEYQAAVVLMSAQLGACLCVVGVLMFLALSADDKRSAHATGVLWGSLLLSTVFQAATDPTIPEDMHKTCVAQSIEESYAIGVVAFLQLVSFLRAESPTNPTARTLASVLSLGLNTWVFSSGIGQLRDPENAAAQMVPVIMSGATGAQKALMGLCLQFLGCYLCALMGLNLYALYTGVARLAHQASLLWGVLFIAVGLHLDSAPQCQSSILYVGSLLNLLSLWQCPADPPERAPGFKGPTLREWPALPLLGSLHLLPAGCERDYFNFFKASQDRWGDFYAYTVPGLGKVHVLTDPNEMLKVIKAEGAHPSGGIEFGWPYVSWGARAGYSATAGPEKGLWGHGADWRRLRGFYQTDLMGSHSMKNYLPGIKRAAELASANAASNQEQLNSFTSRCAFDLFGSAMFGRMLETASEEPDPRFLEFCQETLKSLELVRPLSQDPYQLLMSSLAHTSGFNQFAAAMDASYSVHNQLIAEFCAKQAEGTLDELEQQSYLARALERQAKSDCEVTKQEATDLLFAGLLAAIDTTSCSLNWSLLHLALNPEVQEKLAEEARSDPGAHVGDREYLQAFLREQHRATPVIPASLMKRSSTQVEIHGYQLPRGSLFLLDSHSLQNHSSLMDRLDEFLPERWLPGAAEARKGTAAEMVDHALYRDAFSWGSRKCPGSRIAQLEVAVMVAQLVKDWRVELAEEGVKSVNDVKHFFGETVQPELPRFKLTAR